MPYKTGETLFFGGLHLESFFCLKSDSQHHTCFTVLSGISSFTVTAVISFEIDTVCSVLAWIVRTFVYVCKKNTFASKLFFRLFEILHHGNIIKKKEILSKSSSKV